MKQRCWLVSLSHSEEDVSRAEGELGKKTRRKTIGISQVVQNKWKVQCEAKVPLVYTSVLVTLC